jgi:hypothetical protein
MHVYIVRSRFGPFLCWDGSIGHFGGPEIFLSVRFFGQYRQVRIFYTLPVSRAYSLMLVVESTTDRIFGHLSRTFCIASNVPYVRIFFMFSGYILWKYIFFRPFDNKF